MIYWTSYNFLGYALYKLKYIPMNGLLKSSFITTSIIGGFMVYVYPRKMIARFGDKKIQIPYPLLIIGDFFTHQLPLLDTLYTPYEYPLCGGYLIPSMYIWYGINKYRLKNTDKIYGISLEKLMVATLGLIGSFGYYQHYYLKNKN
jgi:hypothetical protein